MPRQAFRVARNASPCVLFLDEMDTLLVGAQDQQRQHAALAAALARQVPAKHRAPHTLTPSQPHPPPPHFPPFPPLQTAAVDGLVEDQEARTALGAKMEAWARQVRPFLEFHAVQDSFPRMPLKTPCP